MRASSKGQRRVSPLLAIGATTLVAMACLLAMAGASGLSIEAAVSDPHELTRLRFLGIVSNVGILVWASAVSFSVFAALAVADGPAGDRQRWFFISSAGMTVVLLIDDLLLVHEFADDVVAYFIEFDRTRRQKDILEGMVFAGYGALFAVYAFVFRDVLRSARGLRFLQAALAAFAISAAIDFGLLDALGIALPDHGSSFDARSLAEEAPKLVGIVYYSAFYLATARQSLGLHPLHGGTRTPAGGRPSEALERP